MAQRNSDSDADPDTLEVEVDAESGDTSDFEAQSEKEATSESEPDDDASDNAPTTKKTTPRGRSHQKPVNSRQADEKELWKPGAKLEPGTQLIIKKPKARDAGDTPYTESTIHPNTMLFLKEIKANNDRKWLKLQDFNDFIGKLTERIVEIDETIPELPVKDIAMFDLLLKSADVRFSKDQTPYKHDAGPNDQSLGKVRTAVDQANAETDLLFGGVVKNGS
ncbi:hypothetical protein N0V91_002034 [Didymella pomorum]|uniref:Uncharacterized protein n=1 Tax=Didymella pomorum TaxID=749634 RepID=A0A9W8ZM54_9PLEO|nr:hypothetical protein N0V91_002034 [Didymella pomorum]